MLFELKSQDWRDDLAVKNTCCRCRDPQPNIRQSSGNLVEGGEEELKKPERSRTHKKSFNLGP